MSETTNVIAIDIGASSGRVMLGRWDGQHFALHELHRFPNTPLEEPGNLRWNVQRLWQEIKAGIRTYHYRDRRTEGIPQQVNGRIPPQRRYDQTGMQRLPFNTLYQLMSMKLHNDPQLAEADTLLLIPDLFHYWLTGRKVTEYTNATTTEFFDARERRWATDWLQALDLPTHILPPLVQPGTMLGDLLPEVRADVGLRENARVIASTSHDTASAVAAIPGLDQRSA